jgi:hypothetical protein
MFFHWVANSNKRNNSIELLLVNGSISSNQSTIRDHIVQFYDNLFLEQFRWRPKLDDLDFYSIDVEEAFWLERSFGESEVLDVVKGMNSGKVSGPDCFSMAFFQECWKVIKVDIMGVFHDFHASSKFERSLNATFIALIPKKLGPLILRTFTLPVL